MNYLVLLRHGESQWNKENKFTGFKDIDLSENGILAAKSAGTVLKNIKFDNVFTSTLKRAYNTATLALTEAGQGVDLIRHDDLRERDYGDLTGLNKDEMRQKFGEEQVHIWRRSYDVRPPGGESLKDVVARVEPYYRANIEPLVKAGKTPPEHYEIEKRVHGGKYIPVGLDEHVDLGEPGIEVFETFPLDETEG